MRLNIGYSLFSIYRLLMVNFHKNSNFKIFSIQIYKGKYEFFSKNKKYRHFLVFLYKTIYFNYILTNFDEA